MILSLHPDRSTLVQISSHTPNPTLRTKNLALNTNAPVLCEITKKLDNWTKHQVPLTTLLRLTHEVLQCSSVSFLKISG